VALLRGARRAAEINGRLVPINGKPARGAPAPHGQKAVASF